MDANLFIKLAKAFPKALVNTHNEFIIYPKENTYFRLDNITSKLDLDCKVLEYCSRQASKGLEKASREYHKKGMEQYFQRHFSQEELDAIYTKLGNGIKHKLCENFVKSGFDFDLLGLQQCKSL